MDEVSAPVQVESTVVAAPVSPPAAPVSLGRPESNQADRRSQKQKKRDSKTEKRVTLSQDAVRSDRPKRGSYQEDNNKSDLLQLNSSDDLSNVMAVIEEDGSPVTAKRTDNPTSTDSKQHQIANSSFRQPYSRGG